MQVLDGNVAVVTGCARMRGIGRAIALALASAGADVAVTDIDTGGTRNLREGTETESVAQWRGLPSVVAEIEQLGRKAAALTGDVAQRESANRIIADTIAHFGRVDILVNNAAAPHGADRGWTWEVPEEAFDEVVRINLKSVLLMSTAVIKHLLARSAPGRIINIASGAGKRGFPQRAAYCASKFAVIGLTQSLAQELGPHRITVNAICPGLIDTSRQASRGARGESIVQSPVTRLGVPGDIARAVLFLADPSADYITGQSVNVDGGVIMS
jgi:NAD(P)-dependent dehydrogenase (short-subunit alcohol dehydrogenase family)